MTFLKKTSVAIQYSTFTFQHYTMFMLYSEMNYNVYIRTLGLVEYRLLVDTMF